MWPVTSHVYRRATESGLPAATISTRHKRKKTYTLKCCGDCTGDCYQVNLWHEDSEHLSKLVELLLLNLLTFLGVKFPLWPVQYLGCRIGPGMYMVTVSVLRQRLVYRFFFLAAIYTHKYFTLRQHMKTFVSKEHCTKGCWLTMYSNKPNALTSWSRHLRGKTMMRNNWKRTYARRTGWANEQPYFGLWAEGATQVTSCA